MSSNEWAFLAALVGSGGLAAVITAIRRARPDALDSVTTSMQRAVESLSTQLAVVRERCDEAEARMRRLERQIRALGDVPVNGEVMEE